MFEFEEVVESEVAVDAVFFPFFFADLLLEAKAPPESTEGLKDFLSSLSNMRVTRDSKEG